MSEINTNITDLTPEQIHDESRSTARKILHQIDAASEREYNLSAEQLLAERKIGKEQAFVKTRVAKAVENSFGLKDKFMHKDYKWNKVTVGSFIKPEAEYNEVAVNNAEERSFENLMKGDGGLVDQLKSVMPAANDDSMVTEKQSVAA